jgi:hypothetical protein
LGGERLVNHFDVFIVYVPWENGGKLRPVLVFKQQETIAFVFNITTRYKKKSESIRRKYFRINDWQQAGLDKLSYVDINTIHDLPLSALKDKSKIGRLTESDKLRFIEFIKEHNN